MAAFAPSGTRSDVYIRSLEKWFPAVAESSPSTGPSGTPVWVATGIDGTLYRKRLPVDSRHIRQQQGRPTIVFAQPEMLEASDVAKGEEPHLMAGRHEATQREPSSLPARFLIWLDAALKPNSARDAMQTSDQARSGSHFKDLEVPKIVFGDIRLEECIGTGSFGAVYRGIWQGMEVAVKQCKVEDQQEAQALMSEARYLQQYRHARLVSFYGTCYHREKFMMVMDFMPKGSLHGLLFPVGKTRSSLSFPTRMEMALQIAEGLTYLHEHDVIHRDLKSKNIVLDLELSCKICDFGMSCTLERTHITAIAMEGTPKYMAPEQFETRGRLTEKVDMWAMGCVMFEIFCLQVPWTHIKELEPLIRQVVVLKKAPAVPAEADARCRVLIQACHRWDEAKRPAASALEGALRETLSQL